MPSEAEEVRVCAHLTVVEKVEAAINPDATLEKLWRGVALEPLLDRGVACKRRHDD